MSDPNLILFNQNLAQDLFGQKIRNEDLSYLNQILSGNKLVEGSTPISLAYSGHQFGHFVPTLGDGRAVLLGEVLDKSNQRFDLQLKGSGLTPFSRGGDGRAPLGPMIREYLMSEAMYALGVPTTRALGLVKTSDNVLRDKLRPGAVLTRVASSHIRIGTFEFFASRNDLMNLKKLADYAIHRHYPDAADDLNPYMSFLKFVITAQAKLISKWMSLGFVHGVMNTDNMTVSGETIDYGPCAFLENYDPKKVFSSIDRSGRYAYENQPRIGKWNLSVLASCLMPLIFNPDVNFEKESDRNINPDILYSEGNVDQIQVEIENFEKIYRCFWIHEMKLKLGLEESVEFRKNEFNRDQQNLLDEKLAKDYLNILTENEVDFTLGFRLLPEALNGDSNIFLRLFNDLPKINEWIARWQDRLSTLEQNYVDTIKSMNRINPLYIPRNHNIETAIKKAEVDSDIEFSVALLNALENPFEVKSHNEKFSLPAEPSEQVLKTFCGT